MCSVSPALPAKAWKNSRTSSVSKAPILSVGNSVLEDEERPAGHVERDPGQGLIHRQEAVGVAGQSPLVAKRFHERLPERDPCVLDRMMIVDVAVSLGPNRDIDKGMTRQLVEHMIEKADARGDVGKPRSIEIKADLNARLVGLAYDCALAHGDYLCLKPLAPG